MTQIFPTDHFEFEGQEILNDYIKRFSNWGRWGKDDELGAMNHVGPVEVRQATAAVKLGKTISLALPFDANGPQPGGFRINPMNLMTATGTDYKAGAQAKLPEGLGPAKGFGFADDSIYMPNQSSSQWDSLAHIFWRGQMYNGYDAGLVTSGGAERCAITVFKEKFIMRGVLLDVARHRDQRALEPGYAISVEDLEATAASQGVEVRKGDAVIIRTGMLEERRGNWGDYAGGPAPGLSLHAAPWLYEKNVAAMASDTWGCEVRPNEIDVMQPLHIVALVHMGIPIGEIWDLEALAADCAADGVYEFMLCAPSLPISGAVGSPVNPIAIK